MTVARSVAEVLTDRVTLEIESIDRMFGNLYVPRLQHVNGVVQFFGGHRGEPFASSALMDPSASASRCVTCPRCRRSASAPTDGGWPSNVSATTPAIGADATRGLTKPLPYLETRDRRHAACLLRTSMVTVWRAADATKGDGRNPERSAYLRRQTFL
jgi:hypothetical protein